MATITTAIRKAHGDAASLIPVPILKSLPQDELLDRLAHAEDLTARARDPELAEAYAVLAKAMLTAQPRDAVAKEIARRYLRASREPDRAKADAIRRGAIRLIERNPPAPERADVAKARKIAKAKAQGSAAMQAVFDRNGNLIGVVDPADITPATEPRPTGGSEPRPAAGSPPADMVPRPSGEAGTPAGITKTAAVVKNAFRNGVTPAEQNAAFNELNAAAVTVLGAIHGRGSQASGPQSRPRR